MNEAYSLPHYSLEYRCATVFMIVTEGVMFSGVFPLVLLILAAGMMITYVVDRILIVYCYRKSKYDNAPDLLHRAALFTMAIAFALRYLLIFLVTFLKYFVEGSTVGMGARVLPFVFVTATLGFLALYYIIPTVKHRITSVLTALILDETCNAHCCCVSDSFLQSFVLHSTKPSESYADFKFPDKYDAPLEPSDYEMQPMNVRMSQMD